MQLVNKKFQPSNIHLTVESLTIIIEQLLLTIRNLLTAVFIKACTIFNPGSFND